MEVLGPGGLFAVSIELAAGDSFAIQASARYGHSKSYVERLAGQHGFAVLSWIDVPIRLENNLPIPGSVAVIG